MNTFFSNAKAKSRLFGAEWMARAWWDVAQPSTVRRKFVKNSNVFFCQVERLPSRVPRSDLGALMKSPRFLTSSGKLGVHGLLYFDFRYGCGYALVREHGNPNKDNNPNMVYTWRKDLAQLMCQNCSNREQKPVKLTANNCTKRQCCYGERHRLGIHMPLRVPSSGGSSTASAASGSASTSTSSASAGNGNGEGGSEETADAGLTKVLRHFPFVVIFAAFYFSFVAHCFSNNCKAARRGACWPATTQGCNNPAGFGR